MQILTTILNTNILTSIAYMARSCSCVVFTCRFLIIGCLWMSLVSGLGLAEFPKIKHVNKKNRDSISFLAVGDWGRGGEFNQSEVAVKMGDVGKRLKIDFVISTGDNFYHKGLKGVDDPFFKTSFTNVYTVKSLPKMWYTVLGNHDYQGSVEAQLSPALRKRDKRWYCQRNFIVGAGIVDIFFIDTTPFVDDYFTNAKKQYFDWNGILSREEYLSDLLRNLDSELKKSLAPWKIVIGHHTIWSIGYHGDTREMVEQVLPILEANKVHMYINGHDHCLEHLSSKKGTMQFLTSGGGSKAWKNIIHRDQHNDNTTHFYYDGQGFVSVEIIRKKAYITYFDVMGEPIYSLKIK